MASSLLPRSYRRNTYFDEYKRYVRHSLSFSILQYGNDWADYSIDQHGHTHGVIRVHQRALALRDMSTASLLSCAFVDNQAGVRVAMSAAEKKVVVTGLGVVSGLGTGVDAFWKGLLAGESSINRIEGFDPEQFKCQIGSEVCRWA